jgi:hypothetical protein
VGAFPRAVAGSFDCRLLEQPTFGLNSLFVMSKSSCLYILLNLVVNTIDIGILMRIDSRLRCHGTEAPISAMHHKVIHCASFCAILNP